MVPSSIDHNVGQYIPMLLGLPDGFAGIAYTIPVCVAFVKHLFSRTVEDC
jgi:hypothetical protein